jgi:hypothetical protein
MLDKRLLCDSRISWKAKGILAYLLSKPDDWMLRVADLVNQGPEGKAAVRAAIDELITTGYITREQSHYDDGKFAECIYSVYETPHSNNDEEAQPLTENQQTASEPCTENPQAVKPLPENMIHSNTESTEKESINFDSLTTKAVLILPTEQQAMKLFTEVTGMPTIPSSDRRGEWLEVILLLINNFGEAETRRRMEEAFGAWSKKRTKDGRQYSRTHCAWLNYALAGEIPQDIKSKKIHPEIFSQEDNAKAAVARIIAEGQ